MNICYSDCIPSLDTIVVHKVRCLGQAQKSLIMQALGQVFVYTYQWILERKQCCTRPSCWDSWLFSILSFPSFVFVAIWHFVVWTKLMYLEQKESFYQEYWHPLLLSKIMHSQMMSGLNEMLNKECNIYFRVFSTQIIFPITWHQLSGAPAVCL